MQLPIVVVDELGRRQYQRIIMQRCFMLPITETDSTGDHHVMSKFLSTKRSFAIQTF